ncbi:MAG: hypothetical protein H0W68_02320 [Gemmatimonadaceae bacterium]|nr:hypothetical protein [Gemmatimonadaceae bacterium]
MPDDSSSESLGGADAVEKTTYVTGSGTEPEAQRASPRSTPTAGRGAAWYIIGALLVGAVLIYLLGFAGAT